MSIWQGTSLSDGRWVEPRRLEPGVPTRMPGLLFNGLACSDIEEVADDYRRHYQRVGSTRLSHAADTATQPANTYRLLKMLEVLP